MVSLSPSVDPVKVVTDWQAALKRVGDLKARIDDYERRVVESKRELEQATQQERNTWHAVVSLRGEKE